MKSRILACVFVLTMFFSNIVVAEDNDVQSAVKIVLNEPRYYFEQVEISGNASVTSPTTLTVVVTVPDGSINNNDDIFYIGEVKTDESGNFSETIYMEKTDVTGRYTVHIKGKSVEETEGIYSFYTDVQKAEIINEINSFGTKEEVLTFFRESTKAYDVFLNMEVIIKRYLELDAEYQDIIAVKVNNETLNVDTAAEFINRAIVFEEFNVLNDSSVTDDELYGFLMENMHYLSSSELVLEISEWLGEKKSAEILSGILEDNTYSDAEKLIEDFEEKAVVEAFNEAKWVEMEELLEISADYLEITDFETVKKHKKKSSVYQALMETYETSNQILKVYKKAVSDMNKTSTSGGSSDRNGSSSGGGSSSKGSSGVPVMSVGSANEENDKQKEDKQNVEVFVDLTDKHWAYTQVMELVSKGIVSGDGNGYFNPDKNLTREEFVKMAVNAFGLYDENAKCDFLDVSENAWYYKYVASAVESGIISGISDSKFGAGMNLTREDMAVILSRINGVITMEGEVKSFEDDEEIHEYARKAVGRMSFEGMINGMGNNRFEPQAYTTRAQGAVLISKCNFEG